MKNVLNVARKILALTDEELNEAEAMARGQLEYLSPLRMATTAKQHALGNHNLRVVTELRALRETIRAGADSGK